MNNRKPRIENIQNKKTQKYIKKVFDSAKEHGTTVAVLRDEKSGVMKDILEVSGLAPNEVHCFGKSFY